MGLQFDAYKYAYPSRRHVVYGKKGMVCATVPIAAQAGLEMLKKGGNAIDAAIASAVCLTVTEPPSNDIGSDAFALVWVARDKRLYGLNGSGPAPIGIDAEEIRQKYGQIPQSGWAPVTVPGAPSTWATLSKRFGRLPLKEVMEPAIRYAREGYPVSPTVCRLWESGFARNKVSYTEDYLKHWFSVFAPKGRAPHPGETVTLPLHAETLEEIAKTDGESFYRGALADEIDAFSQKTGGYLRKEDLQAYQAQWVEPVSVDYRGYTVSEIPPNGHGIVALMALNILEGYAFHERDTGDCIHKQIEALKLAYADGQRYITDPRFMKVKVEQLLSKEYAARRRREIGARAIMPEAGDPACGGTVYLNSADEEGNMVSFIQSNYMEFGSGVVIPGTGIELHNRGRNFYLDPESENCLAPGKKPYHTIIPGFLSKGGEAIGPFGVMGGFMQPQGHLQVVMNTVDFGMNPQEALDAPRWQWTNGMHIDIEREMAGAITSELVRRGHQVHVVPENIGMGRGQIIWRMADGTLAGATEPRADGTVAVW